ncbi:MAG: cation diffusion facilitator family transporter [Promethearchaeota archaeon]
METRLKFAVAALVVVAFQSALKIYGSWLTGSMSMLSETADTLVDVGFVGITVYSLYQSGKPADHEHHFGHKRVEAISSLFQGTILVTLYGFLTFSAARVLFTGAASVESPGLGAVVVLVSFCVNVAFSRVLIARGKAHKSVALKMQGQNLFGDSIRALFVLVSMLLATRGVTVTDPLFSLVLSTWIVHGAVSLAKEGVAELSDVNPISQKALGEIITRISMMDCVRGVEFFRVRALADTLFFELRLLVDDALTVTAARSVSNEVKSLWRKFFPEFKTEFSVEMNPFAGGVDDASRKVAAELNLARGQVAGVLDVHDVNVFTIESRTYASCSVVVDPSMPLRRVHEAFDELERRVKAREPRVARLVPELETPPWSTAGGAEEISCAAADPEDEAKVRRVVAETLSGFERVRGGRVVSVWDIGGSPSLELVVYFDGDTPAAVVYDEVERLEDELRARLGVPYTRDVILHPEPVDRVEGRD